MSVVLSASMMCADYFSLKEQVKELESSDVHYLHIDIMDGHFVPNLGMSIDLVQQLSTRSRLPLDVHLMVEEPEKVMQPFIDMGSTIITFHAETTPHLHRVTEWIKSSGVQAGVALNPGTPVVAISEIIHMVDIVLVMTVDPGFAGQTLVPHTLHKIEQLKELREAKELSYLIEVDGNVSFENAPIMQRYGADMFVGGSSSIFHQDYRISSAVDRLKKLLYEVKSAGVGEINRQ